MAGPVKKRDVQQKCAKTSESESDSSSSESEDNENVVSKQQEMEITVDFEGRNPVDPDFHGIKTLLQQLFLKAHVDLSNLTNLIIEQNYIGSVVKQSQDDAASDDEDDDINDVFGITTVINISNRQNIQCIQQLRDLLKQMANDHATDATNAMVKNVLENDSAPLGLLINERFVNIPAQISIPLLENLISEMRRATSKRMPFEFTHFIMICKLYKTAEQELSSKKNKNKRRNANEEPEIFWSNPEEEIFAEEAAFSFEFSVELDTDSGLSGSWTESDKEMTPYRRVLLLEASKLQSVVDKIKDNIK